MNKLTIEYWNLEFVYNYFVIQILKSRNIFEMLVLLKNVLNRILFDFQGCMPYYISVQRIEYAYQQVQ